MILFRGIFRVSALAFQGLLLALAQVWVNKMRSLLTMLGIIIGVASVTAVIAVLTGFKMKILSDFETFGTNKVFAGPYRPDTGPKRHASWREIVFKPEQMEGLLEHCPSLKAYTRMTWWQDQVRHGETRVDSVSVNGIDSTWHDIENRFVIQGRPFSALDDLQRRPVCLVSAEIAQKLRLNRDCIGDSVVVGGYRYTIIGIVEPKTESAILPTGESQSEVFVPFSNLWSIHHGGMYVMAATKSAELADDARAELAFFLRKQRHLRPEEPDTFRVQTIQKFVEVFTQVALAITLVAAGIVGISLIVGGVGIMNIMLVSVSERTREIGLRKAVGARPSAILFQFLVEAVTLCLLGGLIGILLGEGVSRMLSHIPGAKLDKAQVPLWATALSFGFAAAVGLIFGMFPAIKAARLDPIDALRHE